MCVGEFVVEQELLAPVRIQLGDLYLAFGQRRRCANGKHRCRSSVDEHCKLGGCVALRGLHLVVESDAQAKARFIRYSRCTRPRLTLMVVRCGAIVVRA
jgi:hypothetical protein